MIKKATLVAPGLAVAGVAVFWGFVVSWQWTSVSPLTASLLIGAIAGNLGLIPSVCESGLKFVSRHVLRAGIVLLGFQLSFSEVSHLGSRGFLAVISVVTVTFFGTQYIARLLGVSPGLGLLTATGYSICGVSAISAMTGAVDGDEDDATYAIALVTLFGSISIFALPALGHLMNMGNVRFGMWAGSSVHDVAQVVATATTYSHQSLAPAVVVKLTRVILLAPLVAVYGYRHSQSKKHEEPHEHPHTGAQRVSLLPMFIAFFLIAVSVRTTGALSTDTLSNLKHIEKTFLALALVGLGAGVKIKKLRLLGSRPIILGVCSWALVLATSVITVRLIPLNL
ncbi:MAG: putative sulfate exporter family transporter [Acidimicrobium sp.]|nr:putative sulfate exporter family transporter [Ilumatobacteraceae bacterium]PHX71919.1 MAG: putative sulfate exporter family transporter [Acidimicrobium sp.]